MQETVRAFIEESDALAAALDGRPPADFEQRTLFKSWCVNDVIVHLHFWNRAVDLALADPEAFRAFVTRVMGEMPTRGFRAIENETIPERGPDLLAAWQAHYRGMEARWSGLDPKQRIAWAGPDMSARSAITARQMETWAHGQAVFDAFGLVRTETDRIRNIVVLGVNTFKWSFKVQGHGEPARMPFLSLTAPSGAEWAFGEPSDEERIEGSAVAFAQIVTQTRNVADTALRVTGPTAQLWMATAQCFAGPKETPPAPGARRIKGVSDT